MTMTGWILPVSVHDQPRSRNLDPAVRKSAALETKHDERRYQGVNPRQDERKMVEGHAQNGVQGGFEAG